MKNTPYTFQMIEPNDGYTLTQSADVELQNRIFSKKVFLAVNDSASNWKEITDEEADKLREEQEILAREDAANNI